MAAQQITDPPRPGTPAWRQLITASKVPAILGLSPWQSPYQLAAEMLGLVEPEPVSDQRQEIFDWGHAAEHGMAAWCETRNPDWSLSGGEVAYTNPELPFPNLVTLDRLATNKNTGELAIREFKTVNSFDVLSKWKKPGEPHSVPAHYEAQVLVQMGVTGIHQAQVVMQAMGPPEVHTVTWNPIAYAKIVTRLTNFWNDLQDGNLPDLDDTTATYETVRGLHPDIQKDTYTFLEVDEALDLLNAKQAEEDAKARYTALRSRLLDKMGDTHRAIAEGVVIARRQKGKGSKPELRVISKAKQELEDTLLR